MNNRIFDFLESFKKTETVVFTYNSENNISFFKINFIDISFNKK